jgi:hypothetical protein
MIDLQLRPDIPSYLDPLERVSARQSVGRWISLLSTIPRPELLQGEWIRAGMDPDGLGSCRH